jgi:hypothetical protein
VDVEALGGGRHCITAMLTRTSSLSGNGVLSRSFGEVVVHGGGAGGGARGTGGTGVVSFLRREGTEPCHSSRGPPYWERDELTSFLVEKLPLLEWGVYSQNGEDGVLAALLSYFSIGNDVAGGGAGGRVGGRAGGRAGGPFYVEFGGEDGMQGNTRLLREERGWTGLLMDGSYEVLNCVLNCVLIELNNICINIFTP